MENPMWEKTQTTMSEIHYRDGRVHNWR